MSLRDCTTAFLIVILGPWVLTAITLAIATKLYP